MHQNVNNDVSNGCNYGFYFVFHIILNFQISLNIGLLHMLSIISKIPYVFQTWYAHIIALLTRCDSFMLFSHKDRKTSLRKLFVLLLC